MRCLGAYAGAEEGLAESSKCWIRLFVVGQQHEMKDLQQCNPSQQT